MDVKRLLAGGIIAITGVGVALPNATAFATGDIYQLLASVLGIVLGLAIIGAGVVLHRSGVSTAHALRVAGWNTLGVVVLGLVVLLSMRYPGVSIPMPIAASILGVSAVAHILIGFNDVRRIRAGELAREREKLAVLNRLARLRLFALKRFSAPVDARRRETGPLGVLADGFLAFGLIVTERPRDLAVVCRQHLRLDPLDADALVAEFLQYLPGFLACRFEFRFGNRLVQLPEDEKVRQFLVCHVSHLTGEAAGTIKVGDAVSAVPDCR